MVNPAGVASQPVAPVFDHRAGGREQLPAPNMFVSNACRSAVARILVVLTLVSETWNVMPTVNAR